MAKSADAPLGPRCGDSTLAKSVLRGLIACIYLRIEHLFSPPSRTAASTIYLRERPCRTLCCKRTNIRPPAGLTESRLMISSSFPRVFRSPAMTDTSASTTQLRSAAEKSTSKAYGATATDFGRSTETKTVNIGATGSAIGQVDGVPICHNTAGETLRLFNAGLSAEVLPATCITPLEPKSKTPER